MHINSISFSIYFRTKTFT